MPPAEVRRMSVEDVLLLSSALAERARAEREAARHG